MSSRCRNESTIQQAFDTAARIDPGLHWEDSPAAAARVSSRIVETALRLEQFPLLGRPGKRPGWREAIVPGLPYILPYRVVNEEILIDTVMHMSRDWQEEI